MRKRPSGNWEIEIRDQRLAGGRLCVSARTTSKPEARRRDAAIRSAMDRGGLDLVERLRGKGEHRLHIAELQGAVEAGDLDRLRRPTLEPLTLGSQIQRLLRTVEATKSPATLYQYDIVCKMVLERWDEHTELAAISSDEIEQWLHEPKQTTGGKPWSPARQKLSAAILGRLFSSTIRREEEVAERNGVPARIRRNPLKNVELPERTDRRVEFLRPREWRALAKATEGRAVCALLGLGCLAGLRLMEAAHLRTDIDVVGLGGSDPVIHVQPRDGEFAWRTKTKRSIRTVPVGAELQQILREHVRLGYAGDRYVIHSPRRDAPMSGQGLRQWVEPAFEAAGIRYGMERDALTFHSLRHTFISWLVQADVSLKKIEQLSGTSVRMILDVYGHLIDQDLRRAVSAIDRRLLEEEES